MICFHDGVCWFFWFFLVSEHGIFYLRAVLNQSSFGSCSKGEFRDDDKRDILRDRRPEKAEAAQ